MQIVKIVLGFLALGLAWSLLFRTGIIFRLNAWLKENVFNDQIVLYSRRRLALLLLFLGIVCLFSGIENVMKDQSVSPESAVQFLEDARTSFKNKEYQRVIMICRILVKSDAKNIPARELMANSYWAMGQKAEARKVIKVILVLDPTNQKFKKLSERFSEKSTK